MYTTSIIKLHSKGDIYAEACEHVTIIADHGDVLICQGKTAFPVRRELLSDVAMVVIEEIEVKDEWKLF